MVWIRHPCLGDDRGSGVVPYLRQSRDNNIMASDAAKGIDIVIGLRLRQAFVLGITHC
jgi:hypothetical protein